MRKINKGNPIQEFSDFVSANHPAQWDQLDYSVRIKTREHILIKEQNYICGYTELPIDINNTSSHIDHYKKRNLYPNLCFSWNNLIVASNDDDFGARYKDNNYIITPNQYSFILNPVTDNPNDYFEYATWGEIIPKKSGLTEAEKDKADETIKAFKLDHQSLINRRKTLFSILNSYDSAFSLDEIKRILSEYGFTSVIEYYYSNYR